MRSPLTTFFAPSPPRGFQLSCADAKRPTADPAVKVQSLFAADNSDSVLADQIGNVAHARLTSTGSEIVVLDEYEPFIKVLDLRGRLIRSFGRAGGGPGYLEHPRWLAVQGDSLLAVVDRTRISEFTLDGEFLASRRLPLKPFGHHRRLRRRVDGLRDDAASWSSGMEPLAACHPENHGIRKLDRAR